jgi:hypothetical protein
MLEAKTCKLEEINSSEVMYSNRSSKGLEYLLGYFLHNVKQQDGYVATFI